MTAVTTLHLLADVAISTEDTTHPPTSYDALLDPVPRTRSMMPKEITNSPNRTRPRPSRCTSPSNFLYCLSGTGVTHPPAAKNRLPRRLHPKTRSEGTQTTRQDLNQRAMKIRSVDNSPVNQQQYHLLRMVYDEITMYPSESWIAILALHTDRSFKQVRHWFSNTRQKCRAGSFIMARTQEGDKVKLRPAAKEAGVVWSDNLFEEVIIVHYFRIKQFLLSSIVTCSADSP